MAICKYCGLDPGWLRSEHKKCVEVYANKLSTIESLFIMAINAMVEDKNIEYALNDFANSFKLEKNYLKQDLIKAWEKAAREALSDNILTKEQEKKLNDLAKIIGADLQTLSKMPIFTSLVKSLVIRDLCEGILPERMVFGRPPVVLHKGEKIIWVFNNVSYFESKTRTRFVGSSQGVSIRVMKGMYYRIGNFRGNPVQTTSLVKMDTGNLIVTNKHLTFIGQHKSSRLKYEKIISYTPYADGIGVCRDGVSAKPQIFITNDGCFSYNLIVNTSQLSLS